MDINQVFLIFGGKPTLIQIIYTEIVRAGI